MNEDFFFLNRQVKFRANFSIRERKIVVLTRGKSEMVIFFFFFLQNRISSFIIVPF